MVGYLACVMCDDYRVSSFIVSRSRVLSRSLKRRSCRRSACCLVQPATTAWPGSFFFVASSHRSVRFGLAHLTGSGLGLAQRNMQKKGRMKRNGSDIHVPESRQGCVFLKKKWN
jgi:hypothetical protein